MITHSVTHSYSLTGTLQYRHAGNAAVSILVNCLTILYDVYINTIICREKEVIPVSILMNNGQLSSL